MNKIQVLDTTLRDGGYCNGWNFGFSKIEKIAHGLQDAEIDVIECGFLTNKIVYDSDKSRFTDLAQMQKVLPVNKRSKYVCMINFGEYDVEQIPEWSRGGIDGFRVAFHKKDMTEAVLYCEALIKKGYEVYVQPMVSMNYSDEEFLRLIGMVNKIHPYAFYIVDSFGMMKIKDLTRLFYMVENNLEESIWIGYHAHNNLQLAYSNARMLSEIITDRDMIIDGSVFGMGRGAGNLNTELFIDYLNEARGMDYKAIYLYRIVDEILMPIYNSNYWGFSMPYYLSAVKRCHPNYASFLDARKTLTIENMEVIMNAIEEEQRSVYDEGYIQKLYMDFMTRDKEYENRDKEFGDMLQGKEVMLIAPGSSVNEEESKIKEYIADHSPIVIGVNFNFEEIPVDYTFVSNLRRFDEMEGECTSKVIVTSNISTEDVFLKIDYASNVSGLDSVRDNAGLMLVRYLSGKKVKKILLAGFDGFSMDMEKNYITSGISQISDRKVLKEVNRGLSQELKKYSEIVCLEFFTEPKFINI